MIYCAGLKNCCSLSFRVSACKVFFLGTTKPTSTKLRKNYRCLHRKIDG